MTNLLQRIFVLVVHFNETENSEIIARLNSELVKALRDPEVGGKLTGLGLELIGDTPEQFAAFLDSEAKRWLPLIRSLNIKLD